MYVQANHRLGQLKEEKDTHKPGGPSKNELVGRVLSSFTFLLADVTTEDYDPPQHSPP